MKRGIIRRILLFCPEPRWLLRPPVALAILALSAYLAIGHTDRPMLVNAGGFSRAVFDSNGKLLRMTTASDEHYRLWTPLAEISPYIREAALLQEDQYFYRHFGVNPLSIVRAAITTYLKRGRRVGASTISMQLARIRFGIDSKNISGKLEQIYRALQIERFYSKDQILEAYLNGASYGGNIEGVGAASYVYFGKPALDLTLAEALALSIIPQHPARRNPSKLQNRGSSNKPEPQVARDRLFVRWLESHPEDESSRVSFTLPLVASSSDQLPFIAPHFVQAALNSSRTGDQRVAVKSTLNLDLQQLAERRIEGYLERKRDYGINNAVALIVDSRDMSIQAQVGSADFFSREIQGQVDGTLARRSPGSTLKPFIYGLAIDQGLIHPGTLLSDAPRSYAAYNPENFDREFDGPISAELALVRSRNLPAIELANQLRGRDLYQFLQEAGIEKMQNRDHYGLAVALGGVEVTMEELVMLYAILANDGLLQPLRRLQQQPESKLKFSARKLLSAEASHLVLTMLATNPRPDSSGLFDNSSGETPVAWKTGTSWGFRDAWSVGIVGPYVLAVWVGNFDGSSNAEFSGRKTAAPLFFDVVDAMLAWKDFPKFHSQFHNYNVEQVEVCALSGGLMGPSCPHSKTVNFIPGVSPIKRCEIHRQVSIDSDSGFRSCFGHQENSYQQVGLRRAVYEFWPSDMTALFAKAGLARRLPPPFGPNCQSLAGGDGAQLEKALVIRSPESKVEYVIKSDQLGQQQIMFSAVADSDAGQIYWFLNDAFIGSQVATEPYSWRPKSPGTYQLRAVDARGRVGTGSFKVVLLR